MLILITGIVLLIASISVPLIYLFLNSGRVYPRITFTPNYLKSFPNHTAWLLAEVRSGEVDLSNNYSIIIEPNESIEHASIFSHRH